jgi:hypothetical protein
MTLLELPDIGQYVHMFAHSPCFMYILPERFSFLWQISEWYHSHSLNVSLLIMRYRRLPNQIHPGFFILRTYALWNNNRIVLVAVLSAFFVSHMRTPHPSSCPSKATIVSSISLLLVAGATSDGLCSHFSLTIILFTIFAPLSQSWLARSQASQAASGTLMLSNSSCLLFLCLCFNLVCSPQLGACNVDSRWLMLSQGLVCLTIIRAIQSWRSSKGLLYIMLVKHNIFYYACGLRESCLTHASVLISDDYRFKVFSAVNIILPMLQLDVRRQYPSIRCSHWCFADVFHILLPRKVCTS